MLPLQTLQAQSFFGNLPIGVLTSVQVLRILCASPPNTTEFPPMTLDQAHEAYNAICLSEGPEISKAYADTVGRFQEGFLADGVTDDIDEAFRRAVDTTQRLLPVLRMRTARA
jgi:hypothetical protein